MTDMSPIQIGLGFAAGIPTGLTAGILLYDAWLTLGHQIRTKTAAILRRQGRENG